MKIASISSFLDPLRRWRKIAPAKFEYSELVKPAAPLRLYLLNEYLVLPPTIAVIAYSPKGQSKTFYQSGQLNLPSGEYWIKCVDMRQKGSAISGIRVKCQDAWWVTLSIEVLWQVKDPLLVANMQDPLNDFEVSCKSATQDFIQRNLHDSLVPTLDLAPMTDSEIAEGILSRIKENNALRDALRGFRIISINIVERRGDPDRTENVQRARVQVDELKREKIITRERTAVAQEKGNLAHQETQTELSLAKMRARYETEIAEISQRVKEIQLEFEQLGKVQDLEQERYLALLETVSNSISQYTALRIQMQNTPGIQQNLDNSQLNSMLKAFVDLTSDIPNITGKSNQLPKPADSSSAAEDTIDILPAFDE